MTKRQKHKHMKRLRSWHHIGVGNDHRFQRMAKKIDRVLAADKLRGGPSADT